ncbi:MAG: group II intron reverse transcriptase/maturase [Actinobacteria bacterium]|nr:group II intron reverse transcriptase/maturase [Planctomycetota bacterium]MBU4391880.1 group II intron reverse transcriptase/maturase [Actinomycetota bacterium]MBU4402491.1 group II intron reverse transcriptase/maturase [Actinomycetota bacterium]MBU4442108.1 group II intron reverse transcriptase/maturase [Actinomycetota bacterium]MCG2818271.1 group II intron reverse transcriptase/maturase [Actinomycetes bacterium]
MGRKRQNNQDQLALWEEGKGEAPTSTHQGTEMPAAERETESPAETEFLMEVVVERENLDRALKRVRKNRGSPGIDGITVKELPGYLKENWPRIREQLLSGTYEPKPVKRVQIPKPNGGVRNLGIPTVLDRFIQQAILQVLTPTWDPTFSESSYGFRPGRSAHQAVAQAQTYIAEGHNWVVDLDLDKFFDRVNHDMLMGRIAKRVEDKRMLKIIRAFLNSGVMEGGLVSPTVEGTPQGGPLSPLLSNIMLDDLDRELERRGHKFVRYADDIVIYVRSERAGRRVMESITRFITRKLKLKVNSEKSVVDRPRKRSYLAFSFTGGENPRRRIAPKAIARFKKRIRELTRRTRGISIEQMIADLRRYLLGWRAYFGFCQTPSVLRELDSWIRRRLRSVIWKQWIRGRTRYAELRSRDIGRELAAKTAGSPHGPWRISRSPALNYAFPNAHFHALGLPTLEHGLIA